MNDWEIKQWTEYLTKLGYSQEDISKILDNIKSKRKGAPNGLMKLRFIKLAPPPWVKQYTISADEKSKQDKLLKALEMTKRDIVRDLSIGMGTNNPIGLEAIAAFNAQHVYTPLAAFEWGYPIQTLLGISGGHLLGNLGGEYYGERGALLGGIVGGFAGGMAKGPTMQRVLDWPMLFTYAPNRAAHFYVNVSPGSYHAIGGESKRMLLRRWVKDMLKGKDANTDVTKWDQDAFADDLLRQYNFLPATLVKDARRNAYRIYNGLPLDMSVFIKNTDGTYSLNLKWWEDQMINGDFSKTIEAMKRTRGVDMTKYAENIRNGEIPIPGGIPVDYMSTVGGNLEHLNTYDLGQQTIGGIPTREFSVDELIDTFDAHPFRRNGAFNRGDPKHPYGDLITERVLHHINKLGAKAEEYLNDKRLDYIKPDLYEEGVPELEIWLARPLNEKLKIKLLDPILYKALTVANKVANLTTELIERIIPGLHKLNEWGKNFEVGQVTGSIPWVQKTKVPITKHTTFKTNKEGIPFTFRTRVLYGFHPEPYQLLPIDVLLYQNNGVLPIKLNTFKTPRIKLELDLPNKNILKHETSK